jgi:eukaryotic-like serine/threonine-protein kinase
VGSPVVIGSQWRVVAIFVGGACRRGGHETVSRMTDGDAATSAQFVCRRTGRTYRVGEQLARTERSRIYAVESDSTPSAVGLVFKCYEPGVFEEEPHLESRIRAMISHPPAYRAAETGHVCCAWPEDLAVVDAAFAGYVMPRVDTEHAVRLHDLVEGGDTADSPETSWSSRLTWADRVLIGANLAGAVARLHDDDVVVGDLQSRDVVVAPGHRVTLLGCDAMQVTDAASGSSYPCRSEGRLLAPPELMVSSGWVTLRPRSSDLFALAVELHLLLDGRHPFDGVWRGRGGIPSASVLAQNGLWCHAGDDRLDPAPGATPSGLLPDTVQRYFRAAFVDGAQHPYDRPSARMWEAELHRLHESLTRCAQVPGHVYGNHLDRCPWCMSTQRAAEPRDRPTIAVPLATPGSMPTIRQPSVSARSRPHPPHGAAAPRPGPPLVRTPVLAPTRVDISADEHGQSPRARRAVADGPFSSRRNRSPAARARGRSGVRRIAAWLAVAVVGIAGVGTVSALRSSAPGSGAPSITVATRTTSAPAAPPAGPAQALEQIHTQDSRAAEDLADSWVAQLAAQPPAPATGDTAASSAILAGHRAVQRVYPNALLLWAADWNYAGNSWVTVLNQRFASADDANRWCDAQHREPRQCFAKRLSHTGTVTGSVKYRG